MILGSDGSISLWVCSANHNLFSSVTPDRIPIILIVSSWSIKFEVEYMDKQTLEDVYIAWAKQDELLIMILSISDTPINDLISYLK